jgi:hypothetical protein
MEEIAAHMGYVGKAAFSEFKQKLEQQSAHWHAGHEFRWMGSDFPKQCQVRERRA